MTPLSPVAFSQPGPDRPLELAPVAVEAGPGVELEVIAASPCPWDRLAPADGRWPRRPGGVLAGRDPQGRVLLCGGFLPCGRCRPCQAGLHLACQSPLRPGWNGPGGLATRLRLPADFLAPAPPDLDPGRAATAVALLAAAGLTYQAQAAAGMVPGDTVILVGATGVAGALSAALLVAGGLEPLRVTPGGAELPRPEELAPRCHLLDLAPSARSLEAWAGLAPLCLSATLVGPLPASLPARLDRLLGGPLALRWASDLHPHLCLDVAALALSGRVAVGQHHQPLPPERFGAGFESWCHDPGTPWPVLMPSQP